MLSTSSLQDFNRKYDSSRESDGVISRGQFLISFPLEKLNRLTLEDYAIGRQNDSFCTFVEARTRKWARIFGATSTKFGIYFGRTKSDPTRKYRPSKKFGKNNEEAFSNIRIALLALIEAGSKKDFEAIDKNPLSQMLKAKILSLYFSDLYLNICSLDRLEAVADGLGVPEEDWLGPSHCQNLFMKIKAKNPITKKWSNLKFTSYLLEQFYPKSVVLNVLKKPRKKSKRKIDFDALRAKQAEIGRKSEEFAFQREKERLIGLGYFDLAEKIKDRRDRPAYGYDFLSYEDHEHERYIEVKSVGKDRVKGIHRFFLPENEYEISKSKDCRETYYFYLVFYDANGEPKELSIRRADEVYKNSDLIPYGYTVEFEYQQEKLQGKSKPLRH